MNRQESCSVRDMDINIFCNSDNLEYSTWEWASLSFWRLLDTLINDQAYLEIQSRLYLARKECEHLSPNVHGWFCLTKQGICWRTLRKSESESFRAKQAGPPFTQGDTSALAQNRHPGKPLPSLFLLPHSPYLAQRKSLAGKFRISLNLGIVGKFLYHIYKGS